MKIKQIDVVPKTCFEELARGQTFLAGSASILWVKVDYPDETFAYTLAEGIVGRFQPSDKVRPIDAEVIYSL